MFTCEMIIYPCSWSSMSSPSYFTDHRSALYIATPFRALWPHTRTGIFWISMKCTRTWSGPIGSILNSDIDISQLPLLVMCPQANEPNMWAAKYCYLEAHLLVAVGNLFQHYIVIGAWCYNIVRRPTAEMNNFFGTPWIPNIMLCKSNFPGEWTHLLTRYVVVLTVLNTYSFDGISI